MTIVSLTMTVDVCARHQHDRVRVDGLPTCGGSLMTNGRAAALLHVWSVFSVMMIAVMCCTYLCTYRTVYDWAVSPLEVAVTARRLAYIPIR
jgi:hypothetical protein